MCPNQCCIFRSVSAGTDGKSCTGMQTSTRHPHVPPRPKFRLVSVGFHIPAEILFWLFIIIFFLCFFFFCFCFCFCVYFFFWFFCFASASASSAASASASSSALLLLLLCFFCFFFFFFHPALSLFLYLWWTARRTAVTLQLVMKNQSSFQSTFICMVN